MSEGRLGIMYKITELPQVGLGLLTAGFLGQCSTN